MVMAMDVKVDASLDITNKHIEKITVEIIYTKGSRPCVHDTEKIIEMLNNAAYFFQDTANDK